MSRLPTLEQILQLGTVRDLVVGPEHLDINNHMNVTHYLDIGGRAMGDAFAAFGLSGDRIDTLGQSIFTAEHHLVYYSELRLGTPVSVHCRLLGRSERTMHAMSFIVDRASERVSCTVELSAVNVDFATRRPVALSEEPAALMDVMLDEHEALDWDAPVCGAMQLRNPVRGA
jgi:acyl-CoA thioester hydrolase